MKSDRMDETVYTDFLVIGSGIAGLTFALRTSEFAPTLILTKKSRADSNTNWAQGGIASVLDEGDKEELHIADTLTAGAGLCDVEAVNVLVHEGPNRVRDLMNLGAQFTKERGADGLDHLALGREGGHSRNRIVFAADRTGWECERTLLEAAEKREQLRIHEHDFVLDIQLGETSEGLRCLGVRTVDQTSGRVRNYRAKAVLLATGGCGQVFQHTTNPSIATGDGIAMALRAGARIANMEFVQFHPTTLFHPDGNSFLISEAVRGEGGILRTADGSTFADAYHPLGALAPRDVVARAIHTERKRRGEQCVFLDVTHLEADYLRDRFPTIYQRCLALGIDITQQPIPVVPAAHYACGGVITDLFGKTDIPGLYAAGEVTMTGVHGANRLASNSLLEAMVFGYRAANSALNEDPVGEHHLVHLPKVIQGAEPSHSPEIVGRLRTTMDRLVGIVRTTSELKEAAAVVASIREEIAAPSGAPSTNMGLGELNNVATTADLIVQSALARTESRGLHYTTDYPETSASRFNTVASLSPSGELRVETIPCE